jgi:Ca2+-transporting ATPase
MTELKERWFRLTAEEALGRLKSDRSQGLTAEDAAERLRARGPNELIAKGAKSPWAILWEQLTATMVLILIAAAVVSALLRDYTDAIAIAAIVVLNALFGFAQEYKAEKALAALKKLAAPSVRVRRQGHVLEVPSRALVPGDIILLEAGNLVPADGRLLEAAGLGVQEAALTGESAPVDKEVDALSADDLSLGDRRNMVYMGTVVSRGRGEVVVTETGMATELGRIASMLQTARQEPTPLQKRLDHLGKRLALAALAIVAVVYVLGLLRGEDSRVMFLTAVSLAVAAVPEGLAAVVTIALALGSQRMFKRRALIRRLPAVETLGSVMVICSDKTGTLTENRMIATVLNVAGRRVDLELTEGGEPGADRKVGDDPAMILLLSAGVLCNDAVLEKTGEEVRVIGDPTEGALLAVADRQGLAKGALDGIFPRVGEVPFDSQRKRMTTVHEFRPDAKFSAWIGPSPFVAFTKGAVGSLLEISNRVWTDGRVEPINDAWRDRIRQATEEMAQKGMRVLGAGFRPLEAPSSNGREEKDLIFVGLVAMIDPPRREAKAAVETCRSAGIRTCMITGDHPLTAQYVAARLGIDEGGRVVLGQELEKLSMPELEKIVGEVSVYARVAPEHKLKIVQALQNKGLVVAMTGDGVNDAPALKTADIGVAMGITGTDVSKEASDMVLMDDNFATIVAAVEEGRIIYDNIRKFIKYLLTTNSAEVLIMLIAPFLGMPLPLLPLQVLWINLISDGPTALTLAVEPGEKDVMQRPPHDPQESLFARGLGLHAVGVGCVMTLVCLGVGAWYWRAGNEGWQTMVFTTVALSQMGNVLAVRSERESVFRIGFLSNKWLLGSVVAVVLLQVAVIYVPFAQRLLKTVALPPQDLLISLGMSTVVFWTIELGKWVKRRGAGNRSGQKR